ncbi:MAG: hypothetical protein RJA99_4259 [Pseudomonadota bacterium]|jgi:hypothetical protein
MSDELKPCPFCGGKAFFDQEDGGGHFVMCDRCSASTNLRYACGDDPRPLLAEQWNRRTNPTAPSAEDRYCDSHCTWADHAPGCKYAPSAESEAVQPVAWLYRTGAAPHDTILSPSRWQSVPDHTTETPLYATSPALPAEISDANTVLETFDLIRNLALHHASFSWAPVVMVSTEHYDALIDQVRPLPDAARDDDCTDCDRLRKRMADLLTRTAISLRGEPPPLTSWSWHDLPELAAAAIAAIDVMQKAAAHAAAAPLPDAAREAMRGAVEWLQSEQDAADEDCGDPGCDECEGIVRPRQRIIDALRAQLGAA